MPSRPALNAIYEEDFLGFSYGSGRSAHHTMDALVFGIGGRKVNWILDARLYLTLTPARNPWPASHGWCHPANDRHVAECGVLEAGNLHRSPRALFMSAAGKGFASMVRAWIVALPSCPTAMRITSR